MRGLAETLGIATNTVAKAYRALEADGVIETHGRKGTLIAARRMHDAETDTAARAYAPAGPPAGAVEGRGAAPGRPVTGSRDIG
ncbi:GntR family transcriptional regulator [Aeromicrobium sp. UC242_57]|uniref:GntR family transcriptional regulator n=1 Tax=Aeromicrobium sp. UC242_57 TaxID=3374624 RepID=UPI0037B20BEF